jgi:hypothetical protein
LIQKEKAGAMSQIVVRRATIIAKILHLYRNS